MKTILGILFASTLICSAQPPDAEKTKGLMNGRWWVELSDSQKVLFAVGYYEYSTAWGIEDGVKCMVTVHTGRVPAVLDDASMVQANSNIAKGDGKDDKQCFNHLRRVSAGVTMGDVRKGLDRFYQEPENLAIHACC